MEHIKKKNKHRINKERMKHRNNKGRITDKSERFRCCMKRNKVILARKYEIKK